MHLVVLVTNTDESDFAQRHPKDAEKFTRLITLVRPDWQVTAFSVKDNEFPSDISAFDGVMITGSPASVNSGESWITRLLNEIRNAVDKKIPIFGACFGHQAIAMALGGKVERNPVGWVFGLVEVDYTKPPHWYNGPEVITQYAAHIEQVTQLPENARVISQTPNCPTAGFVIEDHVYTTQNHPEITPEFFEALVREISGELGPEITEKARQSLARKAEMELSAESIAQFFENALKRSTH